MHIYPQHLLDFLWAESKAARVCGDLLIADKLQNAATAIETHNHVARAPESVKSSWRAKAQELQRSSAKNFETTLEDLA